MNNTTQTKYLQNHFLLLLLAIFLFPFRAFAMGVDFRLPCDSILCDDLALENQHIKSTNERERE